VKGSVDRDLETICLRCLEKEPARRYGSAAALADDLERWLRGEPIQARRISAGGRLVKWARRRPAVAALLVGIILACTALLSLGCSYYLALRAHSHELEGLNTALGQERDAARDAETDALDKSTRLAKELEKSRRSTYALQLALVGSVVSSDPAHGRELLEDSERCPAELRDFTWGYYYRLCKPDRLTVPGASALAYSPDGKILVTAGKDGSVSLWNVATGKVQAVLHGQASGVDGLTFSPDGKLLAAQGGDTVKLWDVAARRELSSFPAYGVLFTADSKVLATTWPEGTVTLRELPSGKERTTFKTDRKPLYLIAFAAEGKTLVTFNPPGETIWYDVSTGHKQASAKCDYPSVTPDGKILAASTPDGALALWDGATGEQKAMVERQGKKYYPVALSPDGRMLAAEVLTIKDGRPEFDLKVWDIASSRTPLDIKWAVVHELAFSPDGKMLAGSGNKSNLFKLESVVSLWDTATGEERNTFPAYPEGITALLFGPDGETLACRNAQPAVQLWAVTPRRATTIPAAGLAPFTTGVFSPDSKSLAIPTFAPDVQKLQEGSLRPGQGNVHLWDLGTHQEQAPLDGLNPAFAPGGKTLLRVSADGRLKLRDLATGQERLPPPGAAGKVKGVAFSPDGKVLAGLSESRDGEKPVLVVKLWDAATWEERAVFHGVPDQSELVGFSPDGGTLVTFGMKAPVVLWDVATGQQRATLRGLVGPDLFGPLPFSPDGRTLACRDREKDGDHAVPVIRVYDTVTGQERATLRGQADKEFMSAVFSPDGKTLASCDVGGTLKLFDAKTWQERATLKGHPGASLAFSPDGRTLASASAGSVTLWDTVTAQERATLAAPSQGIGLCFVSFSPDGRILVWRDLMGTVQLWEAAAWDSQAGPAR
jgi:WD40 repeat protein